MTIHYGLIQVQKSITKVLRIVSKVFRYQVQSTWNRIELILQVSPTPRITRRLIIAASSIIGMYWGAEVILQND